MCKRGVNKDDLSYLCLCLLDINHVSRISIPLIYHVEGKSNYYGTSILSVYCTIEFTITCLSQHYDKLIHCRYVNEALNLH